MNNYNYTFLSAEETNEILTATAETVTEEETEFQMSFKIDGDGFLDTLPIMGKGMLGIFIVTAVIVLTVAVLNKVTGGRKKDKTE